MDTTYFGRNFGVMAFKDWLSKEVIYKYYVAYETNQAYIDGITHIQSLGIEVQAIVCDSRRGLLQHFKDLPAQMCHFHQVQKNYDEEMLLLVLATWFEVYQAYINELSISPSTGKSQYSYRRLRSSYHSLKHNAKYLYTYKQYPELNIPNITNTLDGLFSNLKKQINNHQGLSLSRKQEFIDDFFKC